MARLGMIQFAARNATLDSAAAFQLSALPRVAGVVEHNGGEVEVDPESSYVVARFNGASGAEDARIKGFELVQAGLDLLSILGTADLVTQKSTEEHLLAWREGARQIALIRSTTTLSFTTGDVTLRVTDAKGKEIKPEPMRPRHHLAYRYFRLSQSSDDLYDAYRNMYMSLELLLSSWHPPVDRERERAWLRRAIRLANDQLDFSKLFSKPPSDVSSELVDRLYTSARLPLFHAKDGRNVLVPSGSFNERKRVLEALELLTKVVLEISSKQFGARRKGGGVFFGWVYQNLRAMYEKGRILMLRGNEPFDKNDNDLDQPKYLNAVAMETEVMDDAEDSRAPLLVGKVEASSLWEGEINQVVVVGPDAPMLFHQLKHPLELDGLDELQYVDGAAIVNTRQPKRRFKR